MDVNDQPGTRPAPHPLVGRHREIETIDRTIGSLGRSDAVLIISGDVGIGKTALLGRARERAIAAGAQTLQAAGVESEADLAFAGLHQLLGPILDLTDRLPAPRRRAIEAAFGMLDERVPDRFHVALAAHQLVVEAASARPQVLLVDDAQWLDGSSLGVLTFIARRIEAGPIGLFLTLREGFPSPLDHEHLPRVPLDRLSTTESAQLLERSAPGIHPIRRAVLLAESAGNPLALVELARSGAYPGADPAALDRIPPTLTARIARTFTARFDQLGREARTALLAASLDGRASLAELTAATTSVLGAPVEESSLDAAVRARLVDIQAGTVTFGHPLIRSAVRMAATSTDVSTMHSALATAIADPERGLWHRAMAATGPDEEIASALNDLAVRARGRGALSAAAGALDRAVVLTGDPGKRAVRLLASAEVAYELGFAEAAEATAAQAAELRLDPGETARLAWLRLMINGDVWREAGAARTFVTLAGTMAAAGDREAAIRSLVPIAHRCWWTTTRPRTRAYVVDAALGIGLPHDDPRLLASIALADPESTGAQVREHVIHRRASDVDPGEAMYLGIASEKAGDMRTAATFLARAVVGLREQGRLELLVQALVHRAWVSTHVGDWAASVEDGEEAAMLAHDTRQPEYGVTGELVAAFARAHQGIDFEEQVARPERALSRAQAGPMLAPLHLARGAMAVGDGRLEEAVRHLLPVFDASAPAFHRFMRWSAVLDLVEAGGQGPHADRVAGIVADLEEISEACGSPLLQATLACARPLLATDASAESLFVRAIEETADAPFLLARTAFSYGRWLRRERRTADARAPLRRAIDGFAALGAASWERRARQELRATGERVRRRGPSNRDHLTAQEIQVAELAAQGLSNQEIGERLFLSHRTVGSHLYRLYPKLEIASRAELREALAALPDDDR